MVGKHQWNRLYFKPKDSYLCSSERLRHVADGEADDRRAAGSS